MKKRIRFKVIGILVTAADTGTAWLGYRDSRQLASPPSEPRKKKTA
ncbi:MAG: hypothetical protein JW963_01300 [Anaerolineales bacterium]|nr:hypothetical protein [Anaerolineales bacterium]